MRNDLIFRIYWDGRSTPSVESPIAAFFGNGWDEHYEYATLPLAVGPTNGTGLVSYFQMPFANGARLEIENQSDINIDCIYFYVDYVEMRKLPVGSGRFHAWYNTQKTAITLRCLRSNFSQIPAPSFTVRPDSLPMPYP